MVVVAKVMVVTAEVPVVATEVAVVMAVTMDMAMMVAILNLTVK